MSNESQPRKWIGSQAWSGIFVLLWFLTYAVLALTSITFVGSNILLGVLAVLIVIAILFGK